MDNLINKYINNPNNFTQTQHKAKPAEKGYFSVPSVSSAMDSFDVETDKLVKPLDGKGHLVNDSLIALPKEFARDTIYTTKAFADGIRGKANDHQLGKMNDLGLKLGGLAIATYLMTKKATPKTKAMEFIGFGAFLASMALWPKIALEIPARLIHGFNFRKQYIDEQGRKKFVSQDPNYIPFDLYKGDKKSEDLDVIGDRAGISRDIPNRHEAVKNHMRKVSVQNNTLWMLTAGIATPLMTALACNAAEGHVSSYFEKADNKKVNEEVLYITKYFGNVAVDKDKSKVHTALNEVESTDSKTKTLLKELKAKPDSIDEKALNKIAETLYEGADADMLEAARQDVRALFEGEKVYKTGKKGISDLANSIHGVMTSALGQTDKVVESLSPEELRKSILNASIRGAVEDMLGEIGTEFSARAPKVAHNMSVLKIDKINFLEDSEATKNMTESQKISYNIKKLITRVYNSNPSLDFVSGMSELEGSNDDTYKNIIKRMKNGADTIGQRLENDTLEISKGKESYIGESVSELFSSKVRETKVSGKNKYIRVLKNGVADVLTTDAQANKSYRLTSGIKKTLTAVADGMRKYEVIDKALSDAAHFKVAEAPETIVANNWGKVSDLFVKKLGITSKEMKKASRSEEYSYTLLCDKLSKICKDEKSYNEFITALGKEMVTLDEKLDAPVDGSKNRIMSQIETNIGRNCDETGNILREHSMGNMAERMTGNWAWVRNTSINDAGSLKRLKREKIRSRVDGVHSSYMRLLQTAEFFRRTGCYEAELAEELGKLDEGQTISPEVLERLSKKYGLTQNIETNRQLIEDGKKLLMRGGASEHYNKSGLHNNRNYFASLYRVVFRPTATHDGAEIAPFVKKTVETLNKIKVNGKDPCRALEERETIPFGNKLVEHMNYLFNGLGSISRSIVDDCEIVKTGQHLGNDAALPTNIFDMIGKSTNKFFHDTIIQKANNKKWMKTFAPILGVTFAATVGAQFLFGKKDSDIQAK